MAEMVNASGSGEQKRRGRPRKSDAAGNLVVPQGSSVASPPVMSAVSSMPVISAAVSETPPAFTLTHSADYSANRTQGRGRPLGSGNWRMLASVGNFTPHIIHVLPGEDFTLKIMSLIQNGQRGICVLSANGAVSSATISQQAGSSGGVITYEGHFEILSVTGSYTVSESGGMPIREGGLSLSLVDANGHVFDGGVAGPLVAATPIQTVVGSFIPIA